MATLQFAGSGSIFPVIARRLNMLVPSRPPYSDETAPGFFTYIEGWTKADYFKDWLPFNLQINEGADVDTAEFGAFTTAPDGTTDTARLLVETEANTLHAFTAGHTNLAQRVFGKIRLAGIFKYAGRRIVLELISAPSGIGGSGTFGCRAVFDLQNGEVAVDNTAFGGVTWTVFPASIRPVGQGWFECYIEALATTDALGIPGGIFGKLKLDNGTGDEAESSSYAGSGLGVYGWRSNMLPSRAWDMRTTTFFDDFDDDTMANIDLTDSRVEGFDWYVGNMFPAYDGNQNVPTDPANIVVADSVITISNHTLPLNLATCASTWLPPSVWEYPDPPTPPPGRNYTTGYVGQGFVAPALFEFRTSFDMVDPGVSPNGLTIWTAGLEYLVGGRSIDTSMVSREIDFFETKNSDGPYSHYLYYGPGFEMTGLGEIGGGTTFLGIRVWRPTGEYGPGVHVYHLGVLYTSIASSVNKPPDSEPTYWGEYDTLYPSAIPPEADFRDFHDYATLCLPATDDEPGQMMTFWDGTMCDMPLTYTSETPDLYYQSDWQQMPIFFGGNATNPISVDWVKVTQ